MSVLGRKLLRDIRQNWSMILAVSAIIAVGIGCFIGMMSAARNLEYARSDYYSYCRLADIWVDLKKVPVHEAKRLARVQGISEIRDRIQFKVVLDLPGARRPVGAMLLSLPDKQSPVINNILLRKGTYFSPNRPNEVIVSEDFAKARNIEPGDTISAVLNNQKKDLVVTGTAISAEFVYMTSPGSMVDEPGSYGLLFVKRSFAEDTFGFNSGCNSLVGLLSPEMRGDSKRIVEELSDRLQPYGVFAGLTRSEQFSAMVLDSEMKQLANMAFIFPLFFLVVAALVLNVLMTRLAEQQRTVIGTLKAIGYDNSTLSLHFLQFAVVTGLLGGVLGCLLGALLGDLTTRGYIAYFSFPQLTSKFYPGLMLAGIFISILFASLGTLKGIRQIMALLPAEAMRQAAPPQGGSILLEKMTYFWRKIGAQWQMIFRTLFRHKGRSLINIFSAAIGSSIVVLAFGFVDSMDEMVRFQFENALLSDYHLSFAGEMSVAGYDEIRRLPGVIHAEPVLTVACTFRNQNHTKRGAIMGITGGGELTTPLDVAGNSISLPPIGLLMTERLMAQLHIKVGDYLEVIPVKGDKTPRKLPVTGRIESMVGLAVYADFRWLNKVLGEQGVVNEVRVLLSHNSRERALFMEKTRNMPGLESLTDLGEQKQALTDQLDGAMRTSALVMIVFAAVIFFGAILNGTLIALSERRREMATFRTMGYFNYEVSRIFLRENLLTNITGTLFGLPLGALFLHGTMKGFVSDAYSFPATIAVQSYLYTVVLAVVFVFVSQLVVKRSLRRQNWVEAMSLKE